MGLSSSVQLTANGEIKKCPKCETTALDREQVDLYFGYRWMNGKQSAQSWCKSCRRSGVKAKAATPVAESAPVSRAQFVKIMTAKPRITSNREEVRSMYHKEFPRDSNWSTRAMKFMVLKLIKKLPHAIVEDKLKVMFSL